MTLDIEPVVDQKNLKPSLTVMGIGGAGNNAVNNMIQSNLNNVDFIVANTDAQALQQSNAQTKLQLGLKRTQGLGAGAKPEVGNDAAVESTEQIADILDGFKENKSDMEKEKIIYEKVKNLCANFPIY